MTRLLRPSISLISSRGTCLPICSQVGARSEQQTTRPSVSVIRIPLPVERARELMDMPRSQLLRESAWLMASAALATSWALFSIVLLYSRIR